MSVRDYLDDRDRVIKHRSGANEEMWGHSLRFSSSGSTLRNELEGGCATGWHQQTTSLNNGGSWVFHGSVGRRGRDVGGPFHTRRMTLRSKGTFPHFRLERLFANGNTSYFYEGMLLPNLEVQRIARAIFNDELDKQVAWQSSAAVKRSDLIVTGEQIMLSVVPTSATANAVVSVGELITEGKLFSTPGRGLADSNPGGEFLNYQFGIAPVVSDVKAFNEAADTFSETIRQYKRDAGKVVRRRTKKRRITETETETITSSYPVNPGGAAISAYLCTSPKLRKTTKIIRDIWYSGAFEYFIPREMSRLEELFFEWSRAYGIVPDPSDVWELLPFSWLVDWQSNTGNAIRHLFLQASEGAVQRYGYVMCHSKVVTTYEWSGMLRIGNVPQPSTFTYVLEEDVKQRERVRPFGVNYTGEELSARQLAILAALGIAK